MFKLFKIKKDPKKTTKIDSKVVNKYIRDRIWPLLRENGFTTFTDRNAWKYENDKIYVLNFQSFNSYLADGVGCTTFSFAINLGVLDQGLTKNLLKKSEPKRPRENECQFRGRVNKTFSQKGLFMPYGRKGDDRNDTYYIKEDGSNLNEVFDSIISEIDNIFGWFDIFRDDQKVLESVISGTEFKCGNVEEPFIYRPYSLVCDYLVRNNQPIKAIAELEKTKENYLKKYPKALNIDPVKRTLADINKRIKKIKKDFKEV